MIIVFSLGGTRAGGKALAIEMKRSRVSEKPVVYCPCWACSVPSQETDPQVPNEKFKYHETEIY